MSKWKEYALSEIGNIITGYTPPILNKEQWDGNVAFYSPADFGHKLYCNYSERTISEIALQKNRTIPINSIMVTCIGSTIGKMALAGNYGITNQQINTIVCDVKFHYLFVYYSLLFNIKKIDALYGVTAIPIVNKQQFSTIKLSIPDYPTQQKIAKILSTIDGQIEKTEAIIAKYQAVKQGMLQDLFTPNKLNEINFELLSLADIADIIPSNVDKKIYVTELPVFLCNYMDVYNNRYLTRKNKFSNGSVTSIEIQKFKLRKGDVIITKDSETPDDIAIPSVVTEEIDDLVCGYHLALLRPIKEKVDSRFLMQLIQTEAIKRQFSIKANGSTRYGLTIDAIKSIKISIPNLDIQIRIAECMLTLDNKINTELISMGKMISVKQGLMSDLLSGKVAVIA